MNNHVISIHALLAESDSLTDDVSTGGKIFLSTLSLRRATEQEIIPEEVETYISIHALLAESDVGASQGADIEHISIHALLAESDLMMLSMVAIPIIFLSTLSISCMILTHFYPRSPCGERPHPIGGLITVIEISIHALLAESDIPSH